MQIEPDTLPVGYAGDVYEVFFKVAGSSEKINWSMTSGILPKGINFDKDSGSLSGVPTERFNSHIQIRAEKSLDHQEVSKNFNLQIKIKPLTIDTTLLNPGKVGESYSQTLQASGGTSPYVWSISSGHLPVGIALSPEGQLSGTPTEDDELTVELQVSDQSHPQQTAKKSFTVKIAQKDLTIETISLASGKVRLAYSQILQASGGTSPYVWSIISGKLPDGLSLSSSMGEISGTPTKSGESALTFKVTDNASSPQSKEKTLTLSVASSELVIETNSLPSGTAGQPYPSFTLKVSGGDIPYTFSCTGLPDGLRFSSSTGEISGTPKQPSESELTFKVIDSASSSQSAQKTLKLLVAPSNLVIDTSSLASGKVGESYSQTLQASGGTSPYLWSISSGHLPVGIALSPEGQLSGTPTEDDELTVELQVSDQSHPQQTAKKSLTIKVTKKALTIDTLELHPGTFEQPYSDSLLASGGTPPYTWKVSSGVLPAGIELLSEGQLSGTPTQDGEFTVEFQVSDSSDPQQTAKKSLTIKVIKKALTIDTLELHPGTFEQPYSDSLLASGGTPPYTWSIANGKLPEGIDLSSEGQLSGTPSKAGNFSIEVQVGDSSQSVRKTLGLRIEIKALVSNVSIKDGTQLTNILISPNGSKLFTWHNSFLNQESETPCDGLFIYDIQSQSVTHKLLNMSIVCCAFIDDFIFISSKKENTIKIFDTQTGEILSYFLEIPSLEDNNRYPLSLEASRDGKRIFAVVRDDLGQHSLIIFSIDMSGKIFLNLADLDLFSTSSFTIPPLCSNQDGSLIFIGNTLEKQVLTVTGDSQDKYKKEEKAIDVNNSPHSIVISSDGECIFVLNQGIQNSIVQIDTKRLVVKNTNDLADTPFEAITNLAISPDNSKLYMTDKVYSCLRIFEINSLNFIQRISLLSARYPYGMTISYDGGKIFIANMESGNINIVNLYGI